MTTEEPPWDEGDNAFTVTFKGGKGYEEPWLVMRANSGEALRVRVMAAFGMTDEGLPLVEVINNAAVKFRALSALGSKFGAQVVPQQQSGGADPWSSEEFNNAEQAEPADPNAALLKEIEDATTVKQLQEFWVAHNPLNDVVKAAWSAKGKSLKGGSN